ncbi:FliI/YscN family ATPase [bacterium]|nr:FliI/YscN family ATPase [bacterium]MBU1983898.1 FliI/YscN family ATPase [bacterium]
MSAASVMERSRDVLRAASPYRALGRVQRVRGLIIESLGPRATIGELCRIGARDEQRLAEVVGFNGSTTLLMALEDIGGLYPGSEVEALRRPLTIGLSRHLLGRAVNALGIPMDGGPAIPVSERRSLQAHAPHPLRRRRVTRPLSVGIRSIDGLLTLGEGQRVGIFAGSGIGKSVLLGMMAQFTEADVVVIGLIGERGREVRDFIEKYLGEEGLRKSVLVIETSDRWPLLRIKGAMTTTTIAEYFRDQGLKVLLLMDSVTRVCHAFREVGLSLGEPPATRGYPPSVFAALPKLLERSGNADNGSITALYTVLVEGDDHTEPVADIVRSILDGHIVLSRKLAERNHYPAVDVLTSVSRVMPDVTTKEHSTGAGAVKEIMAAYNEADDLISVGAYAKGTRPLVDRAIAKMPAINAFLRQQLYESSDFRQAVVGVGELAKTE